MISPPAASTTFQHQQSQDTGQHHNCDLRRTACIVRIQPNRKDAARQCLDREIINGAKIGHRLHADDRSSGYHAWARQGQSNPPENPPGPAAERAPDLERTDRLLAKGRSGQKIDIRVQRHGQNKGGCPDRADFGKPVVAGILPAEKGPHPSLHGTSIFQHIDERIGADIGWHRQWREQRPFQPAPARELGHCDQPGCTCADHGGPQTHHAHQHQCVGKIGWQCVGQQMGPNVFGREQRHPGDGRHRQKQHGRQDQRPGGPKIRARAGRGRRLSGGHGRPDTPKSLRCPEICPAFCREQDLHFRGQRVRLRGLPQADAMRL